MIHIIRKSTPRFKKFPSLVVIRLGLTKLQQFKNVKISKEMYVHPNLVPRAHVPFGQHQDTEVWNNQFPETEILGLPASQRMRGLVFMASRDKVDVDTFHKDIQYALERLGKSKFGLESTTVSNFKSKSHEGSGNELVDYSRAPCLGADQKARGLWERDCVHPDVVFRQDGHTFFCKLWHFQMAVIYLLLDLFTSNLGILLSLVSAL